MAARDDGIGGDQQSASHQENIENRSWMYLHWGAERQESAGRGPDPTILKAAIHRGSAAFRCSAAERLSDGLRFPLGTRFLGVVSLNAGPELLMADALTVGYLLTGQVADRRRRGE